MKKEPEEIALMIFIITLGGTLFLIAAMAIASEIPEIIKAWQTL